ncbi:MAG: ORF6N domain-containing protein [Parcubacteria group bacterium]|jgi:hypothetical protein
MGKLSIIPNEIIQQKIYFIRGEKVMFDKDLAELYGVETGALNRAVKRNKERFPNDFMFQLTQKEADIFLRCQIGISNEASLRSQSATSKRGGRRYEPYVFTEQGVAMLSSALNSDRAIQVNIQIMRTFTQIRKMLIGNKELREKIERMEKKYDKNFQVVFQAIKLLLKEDAKPAKRIGFQG